MKFISFQGWGRGRELVEGALGVLVHLQALLTTVF